MLAGFWIFCLGVFVPAFLYVTQPRVGISLALIGLYALLVVLLPAGRKR